MTIGGIPADQLAAQYGTPALFVDLDVLERNIASILAAAEPHNIAVSYAGKALLVTALVRHLHPKPIGIDVCSLGELLTAERGGFESSRLTMHGAGKTGDELEAALGGRVGRIVVDGMDELRSLVARTNGRSLDVLLRFNTGIEAHTHDFIRTAGDRSKFGFGPREADDALALLRTAPSLRPRGVHAHIGSQIYQTQPFAENAERLLELLRYMQSAGFEEADTMIVGGGFGVPMNPQAVSETIDIAKALASVSRVAPSGIHLEIEPGRSIVAQSGISLYRVIAIKHFEGRRFVVVDGSLADNPRPALYGAYHHFQAVANAGHVLVPAAVCGRSCESDELGEAMLPAALAAGDLLAMRDTGAYTYSMASNYNRFIRPPVVAAGSGKTALWAKRETLDDVLRNDC